MKVLIVGCAITIGVFLWRSGRMFARRHGVLTLIWRFALGHALDGFDRTDHGYLVRGTKVRHHSGRASKWAHMPKLHRAGIRWMALIGLCGMTYGLFTARGITIVTLAAAIVLVIALNERRISRKVTGRFHTRSTVRPLSEAIGYQLGITPQQTERTVAIRPDYAAAKSLETVGTVVLPTWYAANPGQREMMEHLIRARLGLDLAFDWQTSQQPMTLEICRAPIPPTLVPLTDMLPAIKALPKDQFLLGVTGRGEHKVWDVSSEDPHCLVSANTRRGKTRLLLLIVCQALAQGAERVIIIDPKRVGVDEVVAGIPGVTVLNDPRKVEAMWGGIHEFREHMDSRVNDFMDDRTREFSRSLLVIDELSQFSAMSKVHWDNIRESKQKAVPPVWNDVAAILWQGAQFSCSMLVFGQRVEHSTLGGLIDSFGTRLLAGYTKRTYERLISVPPVPQSPRQRGRFIFYDGETPTFIQTVLGSDQELRNLAVTGKPIGKTIPGDVLEITESS